MRRRVTHNAEYARNKKTYKAYYERTKDKNKPRVTKYQKELYNTLTPAQKKKRELRTRLRVFKLTMAEYQVLVKKQAGRCAICRERETAKAATGRRRVLSIDHNHRTGKVRGLLCWRCNVGIGFLNECPRRLVSAIKYLKYHARD